MSDEGTLLERHVTLHSHFRCARLNAPGRISFIHSKCVGFFVTTDVYRSLADRDLSVKLRHDARAANCFAEARAASHRLHCLVRNHRTFPVAGDEVRGSLKSHNQPPEYGSTLKNGRGVIAANPGRGAMDRRTRREPGISANASKQSFRSSSVVTQTQTILCAKARVPPKQPSWFRALCLSEQDRSRIQAREGGG